MSDLISRQEMLNRLEEWNTDDPTDKALYNFAWNRIIEQPTIEPRCEACEAFNKTRLLIPQPQRKKGKWIDNHTTCSECGWQMIDDVMQTPNMVGFNYCPNCGAEMSTEDKE